MTSHAFGAKALLLPFVPLLVRPGALVARGQLQAGWGRLNPNTERVEPNTGA